ncbi:mediator of RNA polymerase II transcription subunit 28-like isoform X1 [Prosopis cineraria]|uniref:mediator of RNA polymerase II transcription subunit 28-like isoform X1 n=1 Tax=Prosopis cineraria TaxID=364024 RepID=UPI00240EDB31|nr:mediator of RNA polymerase II transcription subunit 28-like isoform X1 [Prosopis cineraria]XP_054792824.1 mediator of RNA polymerase II transcription subunit 28-like isoform X1 [Prosopis cineraria]
MGDRQVMESQHTVDPPLPSSPPSRDDMVACVMALEAALLPCLPARELQAIDRSPHPSHQMNNYTWAGYNFSLNVDVERHARDFMEAAKKLQLYFISLLRESQPSKAEMLRKEIALMEEELKRKTELIKKQENLIQGWRNELKDQLDKHSTELDRV